MTVAEALELMIAFGSLILSIISVIIILVSYMENKNNRR